MISVVIPLYNKAHTIVNTLSTVIAQTYKDLEVIIVNDGSTDNGVKIIEDNFNDNRIRIIHQENAGVSAARNIGVDEAQGEYVAFLDGDDEWHPDYLATMYILIERYPNAGLFLCGGLVQNADKSIYVRIAKGYEEYKGIIQLFQNPEVFSHTSAMIINKKIFNRTHRFIVGMCKYEDFLASQCLALVSDVVYCGLPLTKYIGGIDGQLTVQNKKNPKSEESVLLYYNQIIKDSISAKGKVDKHLAIYLRYNIRHMFKTYMQNGNVKEIKIKWSGFSESLKGLFPFYEMLIYGIDPKLYELYINITKIIWRMHRYPRMQQTVSINKDLLNW